MFLRLLDTWRWRITLRGRQTYLGRPHMTATPPSLSTISSTRLTGGMHIIQRLKCLMYYTSSSWAMPVRIFSSSISIRYSTFNLKEVYKHTRSSWANAGREQVYGSVSQAGLKGLRPNTLVSFFRQNIFHHDHHDAVFDPSERGECLGRGWTKWQADRQNSSRGARRWLVDWTMRRMMIVFMMRVNMILIPDHDDPDDDHDHANMYDA